MYELDELIARVSKLPKNSGMLTANIIEETVDLSATTISSKIIFLKKLGVLEFMRGQKPFNTSVNSLATVISVITGGKASTIQSMINPILSDGVSHKNNPLNTVKAVNVVEDKLVKLGFKIKENLK